MQIKKYQNTPGRLPKPIAASDMISHVAAIPLKQQRNDVEQLALNINRMRSIDTKEREAGRKAEVQRHKQKRLRAKQIANPHVDAVTVQDNQFAMNVDDTAIEQQVSQEAERNNPYGAYRLSLNQGTLKGLSDAKAEERMGFFANLGDALGVTNARHDANRSLAARMTDLMLWNLDSRNPRSNETYGAITVPMINFGGVPATTTFLGLTTLGLSTLGGGVFNLLWRIIPGTEGKTWSQWFGDKVPLATSGTGELLNPGYLAGGLALTQRARNALYSNVMPAGYNNNPVGKSNMRRAVDALKDFVNLRWKFNPEATPKWYNELASQSGTVMDMNWPTFTEFRDQAWRTAMRVPLRKNQLPIYQINDEIIPSLRFSLFGSPERTYSYNLDNVNAIRRLYGSPDAAFVTNTGNSRGIADMITGNGGYVGRSLNPKTKEIHITDRWDGQPFSDERTPSKVLSKIMPNFEIVETFGGNPFTLKLAFRSHPTPGTWRPTLTSVTPTIGIATPQTNAFSLKPINGATAGIIGTKNRLPILISDILE